MKYFKILFLLLFISLSSFVVHKFYVSIYQVNFNQEKKQIEITARIFYDDLNLALSKKSNTKTNLGLPNETKNDIDLLQTYLKSHFFVKINGKPKEILFLSKETETNIVVCYFKIQNISKIRTIEIESNALFEIDAEQQNIIQFKANGKKQNLLLTQNNVKGLLNF